MLVFATGGTGIVILIIYLSCAMKLQRDSTRKDDKITNTDETINSSPLLESNPVSASLLLVLPAIKIDSKFKVGSSLSAKDVNNLIINSRYFLCTEKSNFDNNPLNLSFSPDPVSYDSSRDTYIRIDIEDGGSLINEEDRFQLRDTIICDEDRKDLTIKELNYLQSLSGLEKFNFV